MSELPIQASPVDRGLILERFVICLPAGTNPQGKEHFSEDARGPEPNDPAPFPRTVNARLAIRRLLAPDAVGQCLSSAWRRGLRG